MTLKLFSTPKRFISKYELKSIAIKIKSKIQ